MTARPHVFVYDGGCGLCRAFKDWLMETAAPGTFESLTFDDPRVPELLAGKSFGEIRESAHVITADGRVRSGHSAILLAISVRWWGRALAAVFGLPLFDPVMKWGYNWIAQNRYRLSCAAPGK
ncbi:DUF393 domain-containing protein [bacterium]|nr:DUF393 domain-containing protein [bacterium]